VIALPAARRTGFTAATAAVLVAAVVLVLAGGGPPSHRHGAPGAAVYDEHCVLASFDSLHVDTVLPAGMPSTRPAELPSTASPPPAEAGPARVPAAGSRSPPTS
jgi:hypothetical protein